MGFLGMTMPKVLNSEFNEEDDLEHDAAMEDTDVLCPEVKVTIEECKTTCEQWKHAIIVQILRKKFLLLFM